MGRVESDLVIGRGEHEGVEDNGEGDEIIEPVPRDDPDKTFSEAVGVGEAEKTHPRVLEHLVVHFENTFTLAIEGYQVYLDFTCHYFFELLSSLLINERILVGLEFHGFLVGALSVILVH